MSKNENTNEVVMYVAACEMIGGDPSDYERDTDRNLFKGTGEDEGKRYNVFAMSDDISMLHAYTQTIEGCKIMEMAGERVLRRINKIIN